MWKRLFVSFYHPWDVCEPRLGTSTVGQRGVCGFLEGGGNASVLVGLGDLFVLGNEKTNRPGYREEYITFTVHGFRAFIEPLNQI